MTKQQMLAQQFAMLYGTAEANLEGMTHAHSLARPMPGGNCANWILGHIVNVHNQLMRVLDLPPVWESEQLKRAGFEPITDEHDAIDWDPLKSRFLETRDRVTHAIASLSDEALAEGGLPHPFGGTATRDELLTLIAFHQTYHVGQLAIARRVAGLPGAVRGPGQDPPGSPRAPRRQAAVTATS